MRSPEMDVTLPSPLSPHPLTIFSPGQFVRLHPATPGEHLCESFTRHNLKWNHLLNKHVGCCGIFSSCCSRAIARVVYVHRCGGDKQALDADFVTIATSDEYDRDLVFVAIYAPIECLSPFDRQQRHDFQPGHFVIVNPYRELQSNEILTPIDCPLIDNSSHWSKLLLEVHHHESARSDGDSSVVVVGDHNRCATHARARVSASALVPVLEPLLESKKNANLCVPFLVASYVPIEAFWKAVISSDVDRIRKTLARIAFRCALKTAIVKCDTKIAGVLLADRRHCAKLTAEEDGATFFDAFFQSSECLSDEPFSHRILSDLLQCVLLLPDEKRPPLLFNTHNESPLHLAVRHRRYRLITAVLDAVDAQVVVDIDLLGVQDENGQTALHAIVEESWSDDPLLPEVFDCLRHFLGKCNRELLLVGDKKEATTLHRCAELSKIGVMELILGRYPDLVNEKRRGDNWTIIHIAVAKADAALFRLANRFTTTFPTANLLHLSLDVIKEIAGDGGDGDGRYENRRRRMRNAIEIVTTLVRHSAEGDTSINWNESVERLVAHVLRRVEVGSWTIDGLVTIAYGLEQIRLKSQITETEPSLYDMAEVCGVDLLQLAVACFLISFGGRFADSGEFDDDGVRRVIVRRVAQRFQQPRTVSTIDCRIFCMICDRLVYGRLGCCGSNAIATTSAAPICHDCGEQIGHCPVCRASPVRITDYEQKLRGTCMCGLPQQPRSGSPGRGKMDEKMVPRCTICFEHAVNRRLSPCGHTICATCARKVKICPFCKEKIRACDVVFFQ